MEMWVFLSALEVLCINFFSFEICCRRKYSGSITAAVLTVFSALVFLTLACFDFLKGDGKLLIIGFVFLLPYIFLYKETILDKGIMPSEKVLDFPVDCNTLTGSVNL